MITVDTMSFLVMISLFTAVPNGGAVPRPRAYPTNYNLVANGYKMDDQP